MTTHSLKTWPGYFERLVDGTKTFEIRRDDRGFAVGDELELREFVPGTQQYTGAVVRRTVSYVTRPAGLHQGYVALGFVATAVPPAEVAKLREFKAYVHNRLDEAGVPEDPPSQHREKGCRIGGRLDWLFAELRGDAP